MNQQLQRKVLLFGATGKTGMEIAKVLYAQKISFSAFVREESINKLSHLNYEIIKGNVLNQSDLTKALKLDQLTDVVISLGSKSLKGDTLRSAGTENIVKALKSVSSEAHIHVVSALGVAESWNQLGRMDKFFANFLLKSVMTDHSKQEDIIRNQALPYHIIRPVGLKDGEATGVVHLHSEGIIPSSAIKRSDVAKFIVDSLMENKTGISAICRQK